MPADRTPRATLAAPVHAPRPRADANPVRLMIGLAGLASAAAFTTAMLPSVTPAAVPAPAVQEAAPSVERVTRYVQLKPGETAPPGATVVARPNPTPKVTVKVVTQTRQSGKP